MSEKEWLQRAWNIENEIRELEERRNRTRDDALRITPSYESRESQSTFSGNSNEAKLISLAEYNLRIDEQINKLYSVKKEIDLTIEAVPDAKLKRLLKLRYIDFKTWEKIAEHLDFADVRWVYVLHGRALKEVRKILSNSSL